MRCRRNSNRFARAVACLSVAVLTSCGGEPDFASRVPADVEKMVRADIPPDGKIHAQSFGKFRIVPDTMFCRQPDGLMIDDRVLTEFLRYLKQPVSLKRGYFRGNGELLSDKECQKENIVITDGGIMSNRKGKPYRLTLAVWQGRGADAAAWVGSVERPDGHYPGILALADDNGRPAGPTSVNLSLQADSIDLSKQYVAHVKGLD